MSSFTQPLTVTKIAGRKWRVERSFRYCIGKEDSDKYIYIPKGFETDFASIPRAFWIIFPPDGQYSQAAVVHDYLYSKRGIVKRRVYKRKSCDKIFLEAMEVLKVNKCVRKTIYRAVRMFGWACW